MFNCCDVVHMRRHSQADGGRAGAPPGLVYPSTFAYLRLCCSMHFSFKKCTRICDFQTKNSKLFWL